jgi:AcrR family transcriptional regulator
MMGEQLSRRERKKKQTRLRLMEVALELFQEGGYDETTVEQIAAGADVAKGTFFNYFETKDAILPALVAWRLKELEDALLLERGAPKSPVARIKMALCLIAQDPLIQRPLAEQVFTAVMHHQQTRTARPGRALVRLLAEQVRQAQTVGEVRPEIDPLNLSSMIHAVFFQQMILYHHGHRPAPLQEMLDGAIDLLLDGAAGPAWRQSP